ncbi:non-homologous end-joining DNA ligase [Vulcaniibacterium tengchongense]|uniref:Bifunctional non-homologous end joining protein LigD n=1 Tax=Vulcaniibacterium tengchongense TaxID=1273429 RepID=A0A3N4VDJ6_9GAMM|nr:non-homologous end-joining DNA ligase [Vulcaniibacterium tengchongense]RPE79863.1 bifunctional non-homologous end joining protein LigD [Vulcaniibacterium tengchongense]
MRTTATAPDAARSGAADAVRPGRPGARRLTSAERVVYPELGVTKGEVAAYYRQIARWLLPELIERPLSLLRCPDGVEGDCFFQKHHADAFGPHVHAVELREKRGRDDYFYVRDIDGVLALVQMNAIEFHVWAARHDAPEQPDRVVFDLDPGEGVPWDQVRDAAREVRDALAGLGLRSWLRLSGGKGLHVVVPLRPGPSWTEVKAFSEAFAGRLAEQAPERYLASASKAERAGRIFVDWLRNTRGATSVASWSLRARPGAPVAMPLRWEELARTSGAAAYDLRRALRRARGLRRDPWAGFARTRQTLPTLS